MAGRACHLVGIIDDHSRFLTGHRFVRRPDAIRFAAVLRSAVERHGVPSILYTGHGGCFTDASPARTCAVLGIRLVHSQPGKPADRGKIEKVFKAIQQQFLVEVTGDKEDPARHPAADLGELNDLLDHWVRVVYHQPALLAQAFAWSAVRLVRKTAAVAVAVEGNVYSVDPFLVGRKVELVFDPFDLSELTVYWAGRKVGRAVPQVIGRHGHPKAPPDEDPEPVTYTGIDYLGLVAGTGQAGLGQQLNLAAPGDPGHPAGQLACLLARLLQNTATGLCADTATVELIADHGYFLHQPGFRRVIAASSQVFTGEPTAVRWKAALHALESGRLPSTGDRTCTSDRAVLLAPGILSPRKDHSQERSLRSRPSDGATRHS